MTELPTSFGKYFLTEKLATGGMAEIYLAKLVGPGGFEKQLVIKQIHPKLTGQRHFVDLFVAEAKTLVTLAHGNIVPVYELGVIDDTYFIAMEYIDGPTLYRLTEALARRDDRMAPAVAAWIAAKILEGLDYAHRKGEGVIHRDLSPRNVMLSRDGEVKLVDFGIAVTLGASDDGADVQSAPTGSFPYMSPEQVRREPLTGQTDLFSVGVLLWEMLVGHRLFARADPDATLAAVTDGEIVRPSVEHPEVPAKLDEVVMRALDRDQTGRWSSAADMLAALQRYLYSLEDTPGPREVGALVARYCPPETRRMPTHADPPPSSDSDVPVPAGPRTAVVERPGAQPRGKQRARTETFATHVDLKVMLERATPLFPIAAITDEPATNVAPRARAATQPPAEEPDDDPSDAPIARPERAPFELPGRQAPSRAGVVLAAIGTMGLGLGAVYVFMKGKGAVLAPDARIRNDAPPYAFGPEAGPDEPDAAVDATEDAPPPPIDASPDAPTAIDPPRDAGRARPDAAAIDAAPAVVTGKIKLVIAVTPWAKVFVDGNPHGTAPREISDLPAGRHLVELVYSPDDEPVQKKQFTITGKDGDTVPLDWNFLKK